MVLLELLIGKEGQLGLFRHADSGIGLLGNHIEQVRCGIGSILNILRDLNILRELIGVDLDGRIDLLRLRGFSSDFHLSIPRGNNVILLRLGVNNAWLRNKRSTDN